MVSHQEKLNGKLIFMIVCVWIFHLHISRMDATRKWALLWLLQWQLTVMTKAIWTHLVSFTRFYQELWEWLWRQIWENVHTAKCILKITFLMHHIAEPPTPKCFLSASKDRQKSRSPEHWEVGDSRDFIRWPGWRPFVAPTVGRIASNITVTEFSSRCRSWFTWLFSILCTLSPPG